MNSFAFTTPSTVQEALQQLDEGAVFKAGGVDLLDMLKESDLRLGITDAFKSPTSHEMGRMVRVSRPSIRRPLSSTMLRTTCALRSSNSALMSFSASRYFSAPSSASNASPSFFLSAL